MISFIPTNKLKKVAVEKIADYAIKKTLNKFDDQVVGIGISWLWMLPANHKFQPAAIRHDAHYDAIEIILGRKTFLQLPKKPYEYEYHVRTAIYEFTNQNITIHQFIKKADDVFYTSCKQIANLNQSSWLKLQAELYYQIVTLWSDLKFKEYEK